MSGWGNVLGKVADQFQGRVERLKNERVRLVKEELELKKRRPITDKINSRVDAINKRKDEIDSLLSSKASD